MFGYWSSFIPDTQGGATMASAQTLFTIILKDPAPKVRIALVVELLLMPVHFYLQLTLVISKSKGLSEILRDIHTLTYQSCRTEEKINWTTAFHKRTCNLTSEAGDTRDVQNELLISIWRLQISSQPKSTHFMPSKYSPWQEMQSFSRCIHFLKVSRYADLGTVIRYCWMADPSACRDWYFRPARNAFNFGNKKKSHGAWSGEYGGWGKTVTFSVFKNAVTIAEVWAGALSCRRRTCLKPVAGRRFW